MDLSTLRDPAGKLVGIVTRSNLADLSLSDGDAGKTLADLMGRKLVVALPDESLRHATNRMLAANVGRLPIVTRAQPDRLIGIVTRSDILKAELWLLEEEQQRKRLLLLTPAAGWRWGQRAKLQQTATATLEPTATTAEPLNQRLENTPSGKG